MSQTKFPIPDDLKMVCLGIVRGHDRRMAGKCSDADRLVIKAVEDAVLNIGDDIMSYRVRKRLVDAIWESCVKGRAFSYRFYDLAVGKTDFYERRRRFLWEVARNMDFL